MSKYKIGKKDKSKNNDPFREQYMPKETIFSVFGDITDKKVGDIGCGSGYYTKDLSKKVGLRGKVYSIDVDPEVIEMITYKTSELKNVINTLSNENKIPLEDNSLDIMLSINSFHEFDDKELTLTEIVRILKPRGRFYMIDFSPTSSPPPGPPKDKRVLKEDAILVCEDVGFRFLKPFNVGLYHYGLMFEKK
ncbi:MAG: class I SAM-dependent methyltransferase [Cyanobacteriota bacterium]